MVDHSQRPVVAKNAYNIEMGPKMLNTSRSPSAMYLKPMPPVYRKLDDRPQKYRNARCSCLAGHTADSKMNPAQLIVYSRAPNVVI